MGTLTVAQKAACETVHRALSERGEDLTRSSLPRGDVDSMQTRQRIADFVVCLPPARLTSMVLRDLNAHGPLKGGYTLRWNRLA